MSHSMFRGKWRRLRIIPALICAIVVLTTYIYLKYRPPYGAYAALAQAELEESGRYAKAQGRKYVKFRQLQGAGFNNQAQEVLLYHHLAALTQRTYVYQPFWWTPRKSFYPLSGFLAGPTRNAISAELFDEICPPEQVKHVTITGSNDAIWSRAQETLRDDEKCIVVDSWILNWRYLASDAIHEIWPTFQKYLAHTFEWPSHIQEMIKRTFSQLNLRFSESDTAGEPYMAIHFRRGDFEQHCKSLADEHVGFTTWSTLPMIQESVHPPALDIYNATNVMGHCYGSLQRILDTLDLHLRARPHLRSVYFLHDGAWDHPLVYLQFYKLEAALKSPERARRAGWSGGVRSVTHSGLIPTSWGERDWKVTVDVEVARRAEVFIGNGYSSLTSQIIALRLADGGQPHDISLL